MPKLLVFVPCEKIIRDAVTQNITLVAVLENLVITVKKPIQTEKVVSVPLKWALFSSWSREPGDEERTYRESITLHDPSGKVLLTGGADLSFGKPLSHSIYSLKVFPVTLPGGSYNLRLTIGDKDGQNQREVAIYPLIVSIEVPSI